MPRKKRALLTNLELGVMRVVWEAGRPLTVREVVELLNQGRLRSLAYNTVQTMLTILKDKGAVRVRPGPGRAHLYTSRLSRDEVTTNMVGDLVDRLFDGEVQPLLLHLVDQKKLSRGELERLKTFIETQLDDGEDG